MSKNPRKIALVDDDASVLEALDNLLRSAGYEPACFPSAEALLATDLFSISCIVTDVRMTGIGGLELQKEIRKSRPEMPFIFMTALPVRSISRRAMLGGAIACLAKPVEAELLLGAILSAIRD